MEKIAIIYSFSARKTGKIAEKIRDAFGSEQLEMVNAEDLTEERFGAFSRAILGVPTWFDGELPNYWDEFVPALEDMDLSGKRYALFGLGNQKGYPENFVDAMGIMADILEAAGATLVGFTSTSGYDFEGSRAERGDSFSGLAIDYETQASLNNERVKNWVEQLRSEFA